MRRRIGVGMPVRRIGVGMPVRRMVFARIIGARLALALLAGGGGGCARLCFGASDLLPQQHLGDETTVILD